MVVVDSQAALAPTTTPMALANPANGTPAILLVEEILVLLGSMTMPTNLTVVVYHNKAVAALVLAILESRELFHDLFLPTGLANRQAVTNALVVDPMKSLPGQVGAHNAKRYPSPFGNLADRETAEEQVSNFIQQRYLKRKQQHSLVAN